MGFAISWVALKSDRSEALQILGLEATGARQDIPGSQFTGVQLKEGWFVVVANNFDFAANLPLEELSASRRLVACWLEEHVMCSGAVEWQNGKQLWSLDHNPENGLDHVEIGGQPPDGLQGFVAEAAQELAAEGGEKSLVDFHFDVPMTLAHSIVGFRHDRDVDSTLSEPFEVLEASEDGASATASGGCAPLLAGLAVLGIYLGYPFLV